MPIRSVSLIGLGALGILFGHRIAASAEAPIAFRVVADAGRIARYRRDGVFSNGERCDFHYITPDDPTAGPADLLLIAVKSRDLPEAIRIARGQVGPDTVILSLLNGISSEAEIARVYGEDRVLLCTAQGMDVVKTGNRLTFDHMGYLAIGGREAGSQAEAVSRVAEFFDQVTIPYRVIPDMRRHQWGKFMLNVGINQALAVFDGDYGVAQRPGEVRDTVIAAMREVVALSVPENINLGEADIRDWLSIVDTLGPGGKPSMCQDLEAGRPTEVDLFAGTVLALGAKHGIDTPVNRMLYDRIRALESGS